MSYRVKDIETGKVFKWRLTKILHEINRGRKLHLKTYNHMYDVAFSLSSTEEDPHKVSAAHKKNALLKRIESIDFNDEAIGFCDSYEED